MFVCAGVYSSLCDSPALICSSQKSRLELLYTIASSVNLCSQLPWGFILDWFGPRVCCCSALAVVISGFLGLCFSLNSSIDLYLLSICLISGGGPGIQISLFHLSELFPNNKSTILAIVTGAFQLGFSIFLIFKLLFTYLTANLHYNPSTVLQYMFGLYCLPLIVLLLLGLHIWPSHPVELFDSINNDHLTFTSQVHPHASLLHQHNQQQYKPLLNEEEEPHKASLPHSQPNLVGRAHSKPFLRQFSSPSFLICLIWMCSCLFWANFYIGSVVEQLFIKANGNKELTRDYTAYFTALLPIGVLGIPLFGWLTDKLGFTWSILATCLLAIGFSICALINDLKLQILSFLLYSFFRSFLFSVMFAYLAHEFGYRHFGLLSGLTLLLAGCVGMATISISSNAVAANDDPNQTFHADQQHFNEINRAQLFTLCASLLFAFYSALTQKKRAIRLLVNHIEQRQAHSTGAVNPSRRNNNYNSLPA
jgi:MFS family permease